MRGGGIGPKTNKQFMTTDFAIISCNISVRIRPITLHEETRVGVCTHNMLKQFPDS